MSARAICKCGCGKQKAFACYDVTPPDQGSQFLWENGAGPPPPVRQTHCLHRCTGLTHIPRWRENVPQEHSEMKAIDLYRWRQTKP